MTLKHILSLALFIQFSTFCHSQGKSQKETDVTKIISRQAAGEDSITYVDSTYMYKVTIPKWWNIKETPSPNFFGGTFPQVNRSESALLIKAFDKENFKTFQNFDRWVISAYRSGDTPNWSNEQMVLFKKELSEFSSVGKAYKVQLKTEETFYNCCYIIVETSSAFLWIDLTAERDTYDDNFKQLKKIMQDFSTF